MKSLEARPDQNWSPKGDFRPAGLTGFGLTGFGLTGFGLTGFGLTGFGLAGVDLLRVGLLRVGLVRGDSALARPSHSDRGPAATEGGRLIPSCWPKPPSCSAVGEGAAYADSGMRPKRVGWPVADSQAD